MMKTVLKGSDCPSWIDKFASDMIPKQDDDPHFDEIINSLSEDALKQVLHKILVRIDDDSVFKEVLKEIGLADDKENKNFMKKSEEHNINVDKALIRNYDETPEDAPINY